MGWTSITLLVIWSSLSNVSPTSTGSCGDRPAGLCSRVLDDFLVFSLVFRGTRTDKSRLTVARECAFHCSGELVLVGSGSSCQLLLHPAKVSCLVQQCCGFALECLPELFISFAGQIQPSPHHGHVSDDLPHGQLKIHLWVVVVG